MSILAAFLLFFRNLLLYNDIDEKQRYMNKGCFGEGFYVL